MSKYMYLGYIKTDDIVRYCEEMARDYELTNPSYSDACSDIGNKCLDLSNRDITEVKHGHWELDGTCSVCKKHTLQSYGNFCCYCGAKMRGKVDE